VPRRDYNEVVEGLAWRAAVRADAVSFERAAAGVRAGGALDARLEELRPLAHGRAGEMATLLQKRAHEAPHAVLSFIGILLDQIEKEDADVRRAHIATLQLLLDVVQPLLSSERNARSQSGKATAAIERIQAILDGLGQLELLDNATARAMAPSREPYAGSVRLAPADALPWPFEAPSVETPSAFIPLLLQPIEWRDRTAAAAGAGPLVFGWRVTE
jgi:hypothetical protein